MTVMTAASTAQDLLRIEDLTVNYGSRPALHGISLSIKRGETVAVVGESGSGKTTMAQSVIRQLARGGRITGGSIWFEGLDLTQASPARMRALRGSSIGLIPQDPMLSLNPVIAVGKQIAEVLVIHRRAAQAQAQDEAIELLRLASIRDPEQTATRFPHQLSGGMRQRVLIAIAMACRPKLIIADEPTSALDVTVQRTILDNIGELSREVGAAVLLVTHDLDVAADRAERVVVMRHGNVVEDGPSQQVLRNPTAPYTRTLVENAPSMRSVQLFDRRPDAGETLRPLLSVEGLSKTFGVGADQVTAVQKISFDVPAGETLAIVGESGSGKSTTARMVMQLERPDSGSIRLDDVDLISASGRELRQLRRRFQMVYQDPLGSLSPRLTVGAILAEPMAIHGILPRSQRPARIAELLDQVDLPIEFARRRPRELSGGQRQRVAIARALAVEPDLLVCDEPVSALDVTVQAQILELLAQLQRERGLTYLFISHDLAVVRQIAHRVIVMREGRAVEAGVTEDVMASPRNPYTHELINAIPGRARRASDEVSA